VLNTVQLIQAGMGVHVSNWRLARTVAIERPALAAGSLSGTALDLVYARRLQLGDPGGGVHRALAALDRTFETDLGRTICDRYFIEGGKAPDAPFKNVPMHLLRSQTGATTFGPAAAAAARIPLQLDDDVIELLIATAFVEVWLAKQGHPGRILINFLSKIELPLIYAMYGAMLAGVDGILVGAGNPEGLPALCSRLANHEPVSRRVSVLYREAGEQFALDFDPRRVAGGKFARSTLKRPAFLAIVSLEDLAKTLAESETQPPDGFVIEHHSAGGHNANPLGPLTRDALGQPIYGEKDEADLAAIRRLDVPFWLAGGYGSRRGLERARARGATGVQVGSVFALAEESGMKSEYRCAILNALKAGVDDSALVRTTLFSPTGFAFKVVQLPTTLSEQEVFDGRRRRCDIGILQQWALSKPADDGTRSLLHRCSAGPVASYASRRGLERSTEGRRCLCNGLVACVGLGQVRDDDSHGLEEPAIVTLGNDLDGIRRLSRQGQVHYWAKDVVEDILGPAH
jgi:NAD(P)H-dependent flavin oxidoreductase YrpB (nitropropane dioxygenase family)